MSYNVSVFPEPERLKGAYAKTGSDGLSLAELSAIESPRADQGASATKLEYCVN